MTLGELQTEASHAAEYLYAQLASGQTLEEASYEHSHCDGVADMAKLQYGEMLFDVAKETAEKMFRYIYIYTYVIIIINFSALVCYSYIA